MFEIEVGKICNCTWILYAEYEILKTSGRWVGSLEFQQNTEYQV